MNELESLKGSRASDSKSESSDHTSHIHNSSVMHEEDNWEDLINEHIGEEGSPTLPSTQTMSMKDKYAALVDFGKIAKLEEAKWKDEKMLKGVDLVQKYEVLKSKTGQSIIINENLDSSFTKRKPTIDLKEETKNVEACEEMHKENMRRFSKVFPRKPVIERRRSFSSPEDNIFRLKRSNSLYELKDSELFECMERFKENHLPKKLLPMYTKVIDKLKNATYEHDPLSPMKPYEASKSMPAKEEGVTTFGPWGELWEYKKQIIKEKSPFGHLKSYKLRCLVVKANDDLRQELLVMQIMNKIKSIWQEAGLPLTLKSYDILVTSNDSGILGKFFTL